jgi:hypothetical protein
LSRTGAEDGLRPLADDDNGLAMSAKDLPSAATPKKIAAKPPRIMAPAPTR